MLLLEEILLVMKGLLRINSDCDKLGWADRSHSQALSRGGRALASGYLEHAVEFLTDDEVQHMPFAARLVTLTIGLRFLTDHLAGDVYFKVAREGHNLDRARVQFKLVESMERQL